MFVYVQLLWRSFIYMSLSCIKIGWVRRPCGLVIPLLGIMFVQEEVIYAFVDFVLKQHFIVWNTLSNLIFVSSSHVQLPTYFEI